MTTSTGTVRDVRHDTGPRLGRRVAHFNRRVTNRLTLPLAPWLPGFGVIIHTGRKSQREYRTPVNVFKAEGAGYVVALTYGRESDWVKNVQAAGGGELITRGRHYRLTAPQIVHDESGHLVATIARPILRFMRVADYLLMKATPV
jgi:deazaflavin-dependent oxidoreductase (nitroreductase family)